MYFGIYGEDEVNRIMLKGKQVYFNKNLWK